MQKFEDTVKIVRGRYKVGFPWKNSNIELPPNFGLYWNKLGTMIKRLQQEKGLLREYNDIFEQQVANGIIEEEGPSLDPDGPIVHYLPHRPVIKPERQTAKIRVLFDASAKTRKTSNSLNECLYSGPTLLPGFAGMLIRFRLSPVVIAGDIEKTFHQVGLTRSDRDATRFIWLRNTEDPLTLSNWRTYRFCRVPFGKRKPLLAPGCYSTSS